MAVILTIGVAVFLLTVTMPVLAVSLTQAGNMALLGFGMDPGIFGFRQSLLDLLPVLVKALLWSWIYNRVVQLVGGLRLEIRPDGDAFRIVRIGPGSAFRIGILLGGLYSLHIVLVHEYSGVLRLYVNSAAFIVGALTLWLWAIIFNRMAERGYGLRVHLQRIQDGCDGQKVAYVVQVNEINPVSALRGRRPLTSCYLPFVQSARIRAVLVHCVAKDSNIHARLCGQHFTPVYLPCSFRHPFLADLGAAI